MILIQNKNFLSSNKEKTAKWWSQIEKWREKKSLNFINSKKTIKPQHAVQRLYELTKDQDTFITTEVGQHQMWAAQHYKFNQPNRWMTSGGLGTMGYGYSESYTEALPDFVKLAEAYGAVGIRAKTPDELDEKIKEMINSHKPVIFDCVVDKQENCYPMIPSGKPHNQMLLGEEDEKEDVSDEGKTLV